MRYRIGIHSHWRTLAIALVAIRFRIAGFQFNVGFNPSSNETMMSCYT